MIPQPIIPPVEKQLIEKELTSDKFVRKTNNGNKEIYIITHHDSPNAMLEVARLREISFRDAGGGTGLEADMDEFDTMENPFKQLIVWSPLEKEIIGGYRFLEGTNIKIVDGKPLCPTAELFHFSKKFISEYLPYTIELGRSFVQPPYQPVYNIRKGLYSLDNLWDGLGALMIDNLSMKYYFGKITMYPRFNIMARDLILFFMYKHFPDPDNLIEPLELVGYVTDIQELGSILNGNSFDEDYKILIRNVRRFGENIPPLVNAYMNLSPSMKTFGTAINHPFGKVEETGILIAIEDIYDIKKDRHISEYRKK